jgi:hypothetical protein
MSESRYQSFEEFWPFYLGEHRDPRNRALHYVGTTLAIGSVATAAVTLNPAWLLVAPVVGYAPAWIGHFVIEKNRPATFKYPVWSLRGDLKMLRLALSGRIGDELETHYPKAAASRQPAAVGGVGAVAPSANGAATA